MRKVGVNNQYYSTYKRDGYRRSKMSEPPVLPTVAPASVPAPRAPPPDQYDDESDEETSNDEDDSVGSLAEFVTNDDSDEEERPRAAAPSDHKRRRIQVEPSDDESEYSSDEVPSDVEPPRASTMAGKYPVRPRPLPPVERYWDARNHDAACRREGFLPQSNGRRRTMGDDMRQKHADAYARLAARGAGAGASAGAGAGASDASAFQSAPARASKQKASEQNIVKSKRTRPYACDVHSTNGAHSLDNAYAFGNDTRSTY